MTPSSGNGTAHRHVLEFVGGRIGLAFPSNRLGNAVTAIERAMQTAGIADAGRFCELLESDSRTFDDLVAQLTVGETYFFREPAHFQFVRHGIAPQLAQRPLAQGPIRVWSAGCASGEEAYSLAIVFVEAGLEQRTQILATDVSRAALTKADQGVYRDWSLRGPGVESARRWMRCQGDSYLVEEPLRRLVVLKYLNLALDTYPTLATGTWGLDLIFCRNVLIYFDHGTVQRVASRLFEALAPGGWLVTASSDPPLGELAPWDVVVGEHGVFYQRPLQSSATSDFDRSSDPHAGILIEVDGRTNVAGPPPQADVPPADVSAKERPQDLSASVETVRMLASVNSTQAERCCAEALVRFPLSGELHCLHSLLLGELGDTSRAARAARRAVYLDRSLAIAHFTLGVVMQRQGDRDHAIRAFRNALQLCFARPTEEGVPLADGASAGRLAAAAIAQLAILDSGKASQPDCTMPARKEASQR